MRNRFMMSDTEREILEALWKMEVPVKQVQLLHLFAERGREWKRQTLNTFLSRLEDKGLVIRENRRVRAAYSETEFRDVQMQEAIDKMYGGKLSNFVIAFAERDALTKEDAEELLKIVEQKLAEMNSK